jgi:hypothetical protein
MKEHEIVRMRKAYRISVGKSDEKKPLGRRSTILTKVCLSLLRLSRVVPRQTTTDALYELVRLYIDHILIKVDGEEVLDFLN